MITTPEAAAWLDGVAATAQLRLDEADAALAAAAAALATAVHTTDWHAPSARAFHTDVYRLRGDVVRARGDVADVGELVARVRSVLRTDGGWP
jgi:hypothetical protein